MVTAAALRRGEGGACHSQSTIHQLRMKWKVWWMGSRWGCLPDTHSSSDLELQPHGEDGVVRAPSSLLPFWNETHANSS